MPWSAVATVAAPVIGGLLGASSQREANRASAKEAAKNRSFQDAQTKEQMDFQERMSSTAYQRQVDDLKSAGLNPMLATGMSGASTPTGAAGSGAQAQMESEGDFGVPQAATTALELRRLKKDLEIAEETKKQIQASTKKTETENTLLEKDVPVSEVKEDIGRGVKKIYERAVNSGKSIKKFFEQEKRNPKGGFKRIPKSKFNANKIRPH